MGKWQNLTAKLKALVIRFAILNGVSDINSIRDTYNLYSSGGHLKGGDTIESSVLQTTTPNYLKALQLTYIEPKPVDSFLGTDYVHNFIQKYKDVMGTDLDAYMTKTSWSPAAKINRAYMRLKNNGYTDVNSITYSTIYNKLAGLNVESWNGFLQFSELTPEYFPNRKSYHMLYNTPEMSGHYYLSYLPSMGTYLYHYANGGNLAHKKSGEGQEESSYLNPETGELALERDYSKPIFGEPLFVRRQNLYKSWTTDKEMGKRIPISFLSNVPSGDYKSLEEALLAIKSTSPNTLSIPINIQEDNGYVSTYQVPISYGFKNPYSEVEKLEAPLTGFEVSKVLAPQLHIAPPVIKLPAELYATYVYADDGRLLARRIWEEGKAGKAYTTADGMDLNDFLKDNPSMLLYPYTDQEFFDHMYNYTDGTTWRIASGDYRKPGNVYLESVSTPTQSPTQNLNIRNGYSNIYNITPDKIKETLDKIFKRSTLEKTVNKKSTGGPLYPFSFQKNPYWKTPVVRYDEGGKTYTVKSGDTLSGIAKSYGVSILDLLDVNKGLNPDVIKVGQTINLVSNNKTPARLQIIDMAWANENPFHKGLKNGLYYPYDDPNGKGKDVGPGLLIGSAIPQKASYTKAELDEAAYLYGLKSLDAIGEAFNNKYGTEEFPTPFDTVSIAPKLLLMDTRYLNGSIPIEGWPSLYNAVATGDWGKALQESRSTYIDADGIKYYDNDRVRRRAETMFPGMFDVSYKKDSKEKPKVTSKKKK